MGELLEDRDDLLFRGRIKVAGGLIGEDQVDIGSQRSGDSHTLLLPAVSLCTYAAARFFSLQRTQLIRSRLRKLIPPFSRGINLHKYLIY